MKTYFKDLILSLASIPSESGKEEAVLRFIGDYLSRWRIPYRLQEVPGCSPNLYVSFSEQPELLLATHVDTVPLSLGLFPPRAEEDRLFGVGVCDAKAGVALLMVLAERLVAEGLKPPVALAFLVDEENEGRGSAKLAEEYRFPYAVVLEPTSLTVAIAEGGSVEFEVEVRGRSVHGSLAYRGANAIERAIELIGELKKLSFLYEEHPLVGPAGLNIEKFSGGDGLLRVPEKAELELEFRILPGQDLKGIIADIEAVLNRYTWVSYRIKDISEAFYVDKNSRIVVALERAIGKALCKEAILSGMPSWTDAAHLAAAGTQAVVFGPGDLTLCHTPEETISLSEVEEAFAVLWELVKSFS
ncbi:MAG TPA: M20 family peptidase [Thermodesulfobacteriaceae bacterium]|nr:M20 family peptidase [Thermodesulfobacteriaceae bacterium]